MYEHEYSADGLIHDAERLKELQSLPLSRKIAITQARIIEWYEHFNGNVYISYSGGKDSTVLADLVHRIFPDVPMVYSNTGLEYLEIQKFAKDKGATFVRPNMAFMDVIKTYGYPIVSKEVSEAIYYARRNGGGQSKEGLCKQLELLGKRPSGSRKEFWEQRTEIDRGLCVAGKTTTRKQKELLRERKDDGKTKSAFNKEKWLPLAQMPFLISHYCCNVMKKSPLKRYQTANDHIVPFIGTLAEESRMRKQA